MLNFTLTDLRYLLALAEEQHFAKAAQKSFVSQPTLSIAIKKLEDNLGVTIFERENHRVIITSTGKEIIQQAQKVLSESQQLLSIAQNNQDPFYHPLKIGAILTIGPYVFPELIQVVINTMPKLRLVVEEGYTETLTQKLLIGEIDMIILATEVNHPELEQINLHEDELGIACSTKHSFAQSSRINNEQLAKETFLLLGSGNCFRDQVLEACPQCNANNNQFANLITTSSLETIKYMVAMNIGISVLPKLAQKSLPSEVCIKPFAKKAPNRTISLVYRRNFLRKSLIANIKELLEQQFAHYNQ